MELWISLPIWSVQRRHQLRMGVAERVDGDAGRARRGTCGPRCPRPSSLGRATARPAGGRRSSSRAVQARRAAFRARSSAYSAVGTARVRQAPRRRADSKGRVFQRGRAMLQRSSDASGAATMRLGEPHGSCVTQPREFFIQGLTRDGKPFRPSDWAERLAGAMSCFRPDGRRRPGRLHRLFAVLRAAHRRRRQGRARQRSAARARADGLGLRHELRPRQRAASSIEPLRRHRLDSRK